VEAAERVVKLANKVHLERAQKVPRGANGSESLCQVRFQRLEGVPKVGTEWLHKVRLNEPAGRVNFELST
jgi:hypothetical protein